MSSIDFKKLKEPFSTNDIEWRMQQSGMTKTTPPKPWGMCLAYITNRAIQDRLDEVCGPENWKNEFFPAPSGGILCRISIKCGDDWIPKEDGAENTDIEAIKGGLSSAMKRAAVQWGIGRYLYNLDTGWAVFSEKGSLSAKIDNKYYKWNPPALPGWATPVTGSPGKNGTVPTEKPEQPENSVRLDPPEVKYMADIDKLDGVQAMSKWWNDNAALLSKESDQTVKKVTSYFMQVKAIFGKKK